MFAQMSTELMLWLSYFQISSLKINWFYYVCLICLVASSVASLELSGIVVLSEVLAESLNFFNAGASVWPVFVNISLELSFLSELSGSEVSSSNEVVGIDTAVEGSTSQGIESLDHVLGHG